jgi:hypothetical protein
MAGTSLRDRFLTPQVARAITSPVGILLGGGVAAATIVAGVPLLAALPLGVAVWAGKVALSIPRGRRSERIDPFTLKEPWRRYVQEALQARNRFEEAVGRTRPGPLRDHLAEIADRMHTGVEECWFIAKRGQALVEARRGIDLADVDRQLAEVADAQRSAESGTASAPDPSLARVAQSLEAQRATAERLDRVIGQAHSELRMLDARLDEAVARTLELSAHAAADATVEGLGTDVDALVTEMESLRQALEETSRTAHHGLAAGGATE